MHRPSGRATAAASSRWSKIGQDRWCWQLNWMLLRVPHWCVCNFKSCHPAGLHVPVRPQRRNVPIVLRIQASWRHTKANETRIEMQNECVTRVRFYLRPVRFTVMGRLAPPSSGSERWATWRRGGATRGSPPTGSCAGGPGCRCTASAGCMRCRRRLLRWGEREGSG